MKIKFKRKNQPLNLYNIGQHLITSMGLLYALSSIAVPSLVAVIFVVLLTGTLL